jgi:hypothetical protein
MIFESAELNIVWLSRNKENPLLAEILFSPNDFLGFHQNRVAGCPRLITLPLVWQKCSLDMVCRKAAAFAKLTASRRRVCALQTALSTFSFLILP